MARAPLDLLCATLARVPQVRLVGEACTFESARDVSELTVQIARRTYLLTLGHAQSGQPREIRSSVHALQSLKSPSTGHRVNVLVAPYLSPAARRICEESDVSYFDLEGNVRLVFGTVYIERQVTGEPKPVRRELQSIFKPRSAQVLKVMLSQPERSWKIVELARAARVSLGHASNVRVALIGREWATVTDQGLVLSDPDALLDAWGQNYQPPAGEQLGFYTTLHGSAFEQAARSALMAQDGQGFAIFASFSASNWMAPFARTGKQYFYADQAGLDRLKSSLALSSASKGDNVVIVLVKDTGLFHDTVQPVPGVFCTSPVQTYLDMAAAGERGREAADHLRRERLKWKNVHGANPSPHRTTTTGQPPQSKRS